MSVEQKTRLPGLDGLRAISIVFVVLFHACQLDAFPHSRWLDPVLLRGYFGVSIFFCISGYLITWLMIQEERRRGTVSLIQFYRRRAFRILPPSLTYLLFISAIIAIGLSASTWGDVVASAAFYRNLMHGKINVPGDTAHFWTLSVEEQFYLVWPAVFILLPKRLRLAGMTACFAASPIWRQLNLKLFGGQNVNFYRADLRANMLIAGCMLALYRNSSRIRPVLSSRTARSGWIFLFAVAVILSSFVPQSHLPKIVAAAVPEVTCLAVAILVNFAVEAPPGLVSIGLAAAPVVWVGQLSYSLYLWQQPFCGEGATFVTVFPLNVLLAVVAASASFYLVERPFLRLRARLEKRTIVDSVAQSVTAEPVP